MSSSNIGIRRKNDELEALRKKMKISDSSSNTLHKILQNSGLVFNEPPEKCVAYVETIQIVRNIKKNIQNSVDYPRNLNGIVSSLTKECENLDMLKHYLYPNIIVRLDDSLEDHAVNETLMKILLSVPTLQNKVIDFLFEKAMDLTIEKQCCPWIQGILKCLSSLETIVDSDKICTNLINLLDVSPEKTVKLEIITAIPDIVGDIEHPNVAVEISRILTDDHDLIPAVLDCLSYLYLSDEQYMQLQKKTLTILNTLPKYNYYPNFIKFLLMPRMNESACAEIIQGLRNCLGWSSTAMNVQEIATSQILTISAIRSAIISSKPIGNSFMKAISSCKIISDHKAIDLVFLLVMYSTTEDRQKQVENIIKKQVKLNTLKEDLLDEAFEKYSPIIKEYLQNAMELSSSLLKSRGDPLLEAFGSHLFCLLFSELEDCRQTVIAELLQLGLDCKQCVMSILIILNNIAKNDMSLLKPQSLQMLTLLDRMDGMNLIEIRAVMNLVCGLAYTYENSIIRDDIHMIIRKELGSSSPTIKIQGILAGVYAVKYLMLFTDNDDNTIEIPDDISYSSITFLSEGPLREAAQIIELISRSTRQFPDMIAFFYDELSEVVSNATSINRHFLAWLTDAVTNDLQQNFITDSVPTEKMGNHKLTMQYCLNSDSEVDETIAVNIAGLSLKSNEEINVSIISPLFQLIQTLHYKQHDGNLSSIDALLGCAVVMPVFDLDLIEDMPEATVTNVLDCLVHCVNWFRELLNAFAAQNDDALKPKILNRIIQIENIELMISKILILSKIAYKPPSCTFDINKYNGGTEKNKRIQATKKTKKNTAAEEADTTDYLRTQVTQNNMVRNKTETVVSILYRSLSLKLLCLFTNDISSDVETTSELNIRSFKYLLKCVNDSLESILMSKVKKNTFLSKPAAVYNHEKAVECVKFLSEVLPNITSHLKYVTTFTETKLSEDTENDNGFLLNSESMCFLECLENLYRLLTIYFRWLGFKNQQQLGLLKSSMRTLASNDNTTDTMSLKDLVYSVAKYLQKHEKYCLQISTAVTLIDLLLAVYEHSKINSVTKILRDMAKSFLSQSWKTLDGDPEKGMIYNQNIDKLAATYFFNNEIVALKSLTLQLMDEIQMLKTRNDSLNSLKCINKGNFPILFRNLGTAVHEAAKNCLDKGLTNSQHLDLWKNVVSILKYMSEISKTIESRNNLSAFFKKTLPILKLFLVQGIPIIEIQFKSHTQEVLEILKILQQTTRFLQSLCCHSRLKKDAALMSKVPLMRQLLETIIYKVKAALAANNCSEAFWMGNLKNKNIHGEVIATQQSIDSEEANEDGDDQLPEDESDESDDEMLNPDSKSVSDVL